MQSTTLTMFLATAAVVTLSACGGSSTGGGQSSFEQLSAEGTDLIARYGNAPTTALSAMPTGTATYSGYAAYSTQFSSPADIVQFAETLSEVELTANFDTSALNGRAFNFRYVDPAYQVSGDLAIAGNITGNSFDASISGTLTESFEGASLPVNWNGNLSGEFVGSNADALRGTGTATGDAGLFGTFPASAVFGAER